MAISAAEAFVFSVAGPEESGAVVGVAAEVVEAACRLEGIVMCNWVWREYRGRPGVTVSIASRNLFD